MRSVPLGGPVVSMVPIYITTINLAICPNSISCRLMVPIYININLCCYMSKLCMVSYYFMIILVCSTAVVVVLGRGGSGAASVGGSVGYVGGVRSCCEDVAMLQGCGHAFY